MSLIAIILCIICIPLIVSSRSYYVQARYEYEKLHRSLHKSDTESDVPTALPTTTPTEIPTTSPFMQWRKPIAEVCRDKKNADKVDICIEWSSSGIPSVAPSAISNIPTWSANIISSIAPSDVQARNENSETNDIVVTNSPTSVPIENIQNNEVHNDISDRVLIELDYFDMSITIMTKQQLRSNDAVQYCQGGDLTRQYEYKAAMQHLHEVYTSSFLTPLMSLNLTFIDVGETNISASCVRESIFYGSVEFQKVDEYQDPTKSEVDKVTFLAFADHRKKGFLDKFQKYYEANCQEIFAYDMLVHLSDHGSHLDTANDGEEDMHDANAILPIVGGIAAALSVVAGLAYYTQRKQNQKQNESDVAKPSSPIRQILHRSRIYGEFESDDDEMVDFEGNNIADAYMDSASIRSASPDTFAKDVQSHLHGKTADI